MPEPDLEVVIDNAPSQITRGGARPGSGRKPKGFVPLPEVKAYNESKARNEAAKADLNELEFKIKSGRYLEREAFRQASATLLAELAQGLRGLPDRLERKFNLDPQKVQLVSDEIDAALASLADGLETFVEQPS